MGVADIEFQENVNNSVLDNDICTKFGGIMHTLSCSHSKITSSKAVYGAHR